MKTKFLVADEIRPEASGKQTILGLFPDDVIIVQISSKAQKLAENNSNDPPGIERLAFLFSLIGLKAGEHKFKANLLAPSGKPYQEAPLEDKIKVEAGKSHTIIFEMKPFIFNEGPGIYSWIINVDDEQHTHQFEMRIG